MEIVNAVPIHDHVFPFEGPPQDVPCPQCGALALIELPWCMLPQRDHTNILCHPGHGGCNTGFDSPDGPGGSNDSPRPLVFDTPESIAKVRLITFQHAMLLEIRTNGAVKSVRGRSVFARARDEFKIKARSRRAVYEAFCKMHGLETKL